MTLLAALWSRDGRPVEASCEAMLKAQRPRSEWVRRIGAHRGLALGTAAADEAGPLDSPSGAFALAADARLDNREDFLTGLGLTAAEAAPIGDPRLMLLCIERWGADVIGRFVGDFAIALWDRRSEQILLARDFAGQRPLHFHEGDGAVAVASMAGGLRALDFVPRGIDERRMVEMLAGVAHEGRRTFFAGVERVEPGEVVSFGRGPTASRIFWTPPGDSIRFSSHADYAEALLEKLDTAVDARLRGVSGTVGAHLSAGLDSSAVATSAALRFPGRVVAFTAVPPERLPRLPAGRFGDEGALAAGTARLHPNIEHRPIPVGNRIPLEQLEREHRLFERPDLNLPNLVWSNRINDEAAAEGIRVMLTGSMGNATISYDGYERLGELLAGGRILRFLSECAASRTRGMTTRALIGLAARRVLPPAAVRALGGFRNRSEHPAAAGVINPAAHGLDEVLARYDRADDTGGDSSVETRVGMIRRVDPAAYNKGVLIGWNLDLRDPTADRRVVEYCLRVPLGEYFREGTPRALIRTALEGRVPESVRLARSRGMQSPHWFSMLTEARGEAARLLAAIAGCEAARRLLDIERMERLLRDWPEPDGGFGPLDYRYGLLRGLSAGEFIRLFSGGRGVPPPAGGSH